jgi:hypothetical protein
MADGQLEWAERPGISLIPFAAVTFVLDSLLPPRDMLLVVGAGKTLSPLPSTAKKKKRRRRRKRNK